MMNCEKESVVKKKIIKYLRDEAGVWCYKNYSGMGMGQAGVPDIIGCWWGKFFAIEVKTEIGKLTPLQENTILEITSQADGVVMIPYGYQDFLDKINDFKTKFI